MNNIFEDVEVTETEIKNTLILEAVRMNQVLNEIYTILDNYFTQGAMPPTLTEVNSEQL